MVEKQENIFKNLVDRQTDWKVMMKPARHRVLKLNHHQDKMVLYLIGLGLGDETDITIKGLNAVKASKRVYLEAYTSILSVGKERLVI
jgi:hypothetical protein